MTRILNKIILLAKYTFHSNAIIHNKLILLIREIYFEHLIYCFLINPKSNKRAFLSTSHLYSKYTIEKCLYSVYDSSSYNIVGIW